MAALLRRALTNEHCSVAEVYMTDLCDEPEAEAVADAAAAAAMVADEGNPDAHALTASVRLSQSRPTEAAPLLRRACELLAAIFRAADGAGGGDDEDEDDDEGGDGDAGLGAGAGAGAIAVRPPRRGGGGGRGGRGGGGGGGGGAEAAMEEAAASPDDDEAAAAAAAAAALVPPWASRLSLAKMCLEAELWPQAADVLDRLLAEDDAQMEVWFLLGEALLHAGELEAAADTVSTAAAMVAAARAAQPAAASKGAKKAAAAAFAKAGAAAGAAGAAPRAAIDFSREAIQALVATPPEELAAQAQQFERLLAKVTERQAAAAGGARGAAAMDDAA